MLPGQEQRKLSKSLKHMDDFCCQRDLSDILTDTMKSKNLTVENAILHRPCMGTLLSDGRLRACVRLLRGKSKRREHQKVREIQKSSDYNVKHDT